MRDAGRRAARAIALAVASLGLMGMGGLGGGESPGRPARDFSAVLTDADGTRMAVTRLTAGGDTSLEGELGRGRLRIPFDNVESIVLEPAATRDRVRAIVTLREGEPVEMSVRSSTTFYGQVPGGAYQIRARDLRRVELGH